MSKFAIIKTGGKQYKVAEGDKLKVEKLSGEAGSKVSFDEVLLVADGEVEVGSPRVTGARVEGTILQQGRAKKVRVVKYKAKTRYRTVHGHRQPFTEVKIEKI